MLTVRLAVPPVAKAVAAFPVVLFVVAADAGPITAAALVPAFGYASLGLSVVLYLASLMTVTAGADGVLLRRMFTSTFIPFASIAAVRADGNGLDLTLRDGKVLHLSTSRARAWRGRYRTACDELVAALTRCARLAAEGSHSPYVELPDDAVRTSAPPYRVAPGPSTRALLGIVHDDVEPAARRAETALVLADMHDDDEGLDVRASLRRAAERVVDPALRVVLTASARGDAKAARAAYAVITSRR